MQKSARISAIALAATLSVFAAACSSSSSGSTTTAASSGIKLGIAFDTGGRGDGTFNDSAARGGDRVKKELGAAVDELEATTAEDRQTNLQTLTSNGDNPIVAVGFAFGDALAKVAAANPKTFYADVDGYFDKAPSNVAFLSFAAEQGSFLVGCAAALKSKTHHVGFIGGQEIDLIKAFQDRKSTRLNSSH